VGGAGNRAVRQNRRVASAPRTPRRRPRRQIPAVGPSTGRRAWWRVGPAAIVAIAAALLVFPLLGGGRERTPPTEIVRPSPPSGGFVVQNIGLGTLVKLPRDPWSTRGCDDRGDPPDEAQPDLRCVVTSGPGVLSIWIYPRGRRGPRTAAELETAKDDLLSASRQREASFRPVNAVVTRYDGLPAIQVRATARILGRPRTIRSTHVFVGGREIVLDAYATRSSFRRVDETVFRPVLRSLEVADDWRRVRAQDEVPGVGR
jgi:hypothetical protein